VRLPLHYHHVSFDRNVAKSEGFSFGTKFISKSIAESIRKKVSNAGKELGVNESTLYNWVCKFRPGGSKKSESGSEMENELKALRRENIRLKQQRDILKKAAAYFANEMI
jgi:transposase